MRAELLALILLTAGCAGIPAQPGRLASPERAAVRRAAVDAAWSLKYYLGRYRLAPALAERLDPQAASFAGENPTIGELIAAVEAQFSANLDETERAALSESSRRTRSYFGLSDSRLFESISGTASLRALRPGWPRELSGVDLAGLPMEDSRGYADSRLGALGALALEASGLSLRLVASEASGASWPPACGARNPRRLNFPGSTNGFTARFAECAGGGYALVLDGFSNRSLYLHELALFKVLLEDAPPAVFHDDASAAVRDDLLLAPFSETGILPKRFDALALGYYDELKTEFAPVSEAQGAGWRAFSARAGTTMFVAVAIEDSWYGESLGASVARLLKSGVKFKTVYFAGSAGALTYLPPYSLAYPSCYRSRAGARIDIPNQFSGESREPCHMAVESPLVETRAFLEKASGLADTIDVEGFALADAAAKNGLGLGTAYLITDYPEPKPVLRHHRLAETRSALRHSGARAYAKRFRTRLETGKRVYRHPLEEFLQTPFDALSGKTAMRELNALLPLSGLEKAFIERVGASSVPVVFRTWPSRLAFMVEDGLALSPVQVDGLKGLKSAETALTPVGEDALYRARDYLFAGVGQNDEEKLYGPVRVILSSAAWRRSFSTRSSGANLLAREGIDPRTAPAPGALDRLRRLFARDAAVPADYALRLASLAVADYRTHAKTRGAAWAARRMRLGIASGDSALWRMIDEDTDAYLEGKIFRSFPLEAVLCIEIGPEDRKKLEGRISVDRASSLPLRPPGQCVE